MSIRILLLACLLFLAPPADAQDHPRSPLPALQDLRANDQLRNRHYELVLHTLRAGRLPDAALLPSGLRPGLDDPDYTAVVAGLKAGRAEYEAPAQAMLDRLNDRARAERLALYLARYYFINERLHEAIPFYERAGLANLSNEEIGDKKFELAYCYFNDAQFDKARDLFANIKEVKGDYYEPGNYYFALLAYNDNDYQAARQSFERIAALPEYRRIVPYYIAEIYYFLGDRARARSEALRLMAQEEKLYYDRELHLLAAQTYFEDGQFADAIPYFEYYYQNSERVRKDELYEMAYSYYRTGEYPKAIDNFRQLSGSRDSLGQTAMYLLGDCYLKTGDKRSARNAFGLCADMSFNDRQREASMLLAGKLAYDAGYYEDASGRLRVFLSSYPSSEFYPEARTIFSDILARNNNYAEAYRYLPEINQSDGSYARVFQKVSYGYAIEQLQNGNLDEAYALLTRSLNYPSDRAYESAALFWKGEIAYRRKDYNEALNLGRVYVASPGAEQSYQVSTPATVQHANITMGYAALKINDYALAQTYFHKAQRPGATGDLVSGIALIREADAAFMRKQLPDAARLYDQAIGTCSQTDADYARLQKSIIFGLQNKIADKVSLLQSLMTRQPESAYANDARYELAVTQMDQDKFAEAINTLKPLAQGDDVSKAPAAWLKTGFAYQQLNREAEAIAAYRHVVTDYRNSEERYVALDALKSLYINGNQPGEYYALLRQANMSDTGKLTADSTYYAAAEAQFASNRLERARDGFVGYLKSFPAGSFQLKAHYYLGESYFQLKDYPSAKNEFAQVLLFPWNDLSENSAKRAGFLYYNSEEYQKSYDSYRQLLDHANSEEMRVLAYGGLVRSSFRTGRYEQSLDYADTLLALRDIGKENTDGVHFFQAKSYMQLQQEDSAFVRFLPLMQSKTSAIAAESGYNAALIYFHRGKLAEAEKTANKAIQSSGGNDYWIVKSYLLLADILTLQKDYFNARATLESILKNNSDPAIRKEAGDKLEDLKKQQRKQSKLEE